MPPRSLSRSLPEGPGTDAPAHFEIGATTCRRASSTSGSESFATRASLRRTATNATNSPSTAKHLVRHWSHWTGGLAGGHASRKRPPVKQAIAGVASSGDLDRKRLAPAKSHLGSLASVMVSAVRIQAS